MDTVVSLNTTTSTEGGPVRALVKKSFGLLFDPGRFFRQELPQMPLTEALAFGIGNAWLAAVIAFFMQTINSLILAQLLDRWMQRLVASEDGFLVWSLSANSFLWTAGLLLLAPFLFLMRAFFSTVGLYLFARLLIEERPGAPEPVNFDGAFRIQAVALVGHWFTIVPIFGSLLAFVVSLILTVTGVRERFAVSTRRAAAIVLAPYALFLMGAIVLGGLFVVTLSQIPLSELLELDGVLGG